MNNQDRKLFNIACKIEKLMYEHCNNHKHFAKEVSWSKMIIDTRRSELCWEFIEAFGDLTKKDNINFEIFTSDDFLKIKIWL